MVRRYLSVLALLAVVAGCDSNTFPYEGTVEVVYTFEILSGDAEDVEVRYSGPNGLIVVNRQPDLPFEATVEVSGLQAVEFRVDGVAAEPLELRYGIVATADGEVRGDVERSVVGEAGPFVRGRRILLL